MFRFTWFRKLRETLAFKEDKGGLKAGTAAKIYTLKLRHVDDVFNHELLWLHNPALGDTIQGEISPEQWQADWRLFAALNRYLPPAVNVYTANQAEVTTISQIFTDVLIWIPQALWDSVREERGEPVRRLVTNLQLRHQQQFRERLWQGRLPHYCVMPAADLPAGEVHCQFGTDIFVPDNKDVLQGQIILHKAEAEYALPSLTFFEDGHELQRPMAWYASQRALQLAGAPQVSRPALAIWFNHSGQEDSIRLRHLPQVNAEHELLLEPLPSGAIQFAHKRTLRGVLRLAFKAGAEDLTILVQPMLTVSTPAETNDGNHTIIGGTIHTPALVLQGIVLPSLGQALIRGQPIAGWQLFLNDQGNLIEWLGDPQTSPYTRLYNLVGSEQLYWQAANQNAEVVTLPFTINVGSAHYQLNAMGQRVLLELPNPDTFALRPRTTYLLGRAPQANPAQEEEALSATLLDIAGSLFQTDGRALTKPTLKSLISSEQVALALEGNYLRVTQLSKTLSSVLLNAQGQEKKCLSPNTVSSDVLVASEYLWVGPYIYQFTLTDEAL